MDNLLALRKRLMRTEKTSQSSRTDFSSVRLSDQSDDCSQQGYSPALTTEDLSPSDPMVPAMNNRHVTMAERMTPQKCVFSNISPTSSFGGRTSQVPSTFAIEQENEQLWKKLSTLREDNARLVSQNHSLVREIESIQAELTQSKVKFCHLEPSINEKALHISQLNEDILGLEAEVEAQEKVLRVAEEKLEESQWMVAEKEKLLEKLSDECKRVKNELYEQGRRRKRAEQQRNEALYSAEELSAAFKQYKEKTTEELLMFQANEQELQRRLDQYDKDRVELFEKCTMFEKELESKNEEIRIIMGQSCDVKLVQHDLEAKNAGLFSVLSDSKEKIKMLEGELTDKEAILKERDALRVENAGLRGLTTSQSEKLLQVNKELEVAKLEVKNLESVLQVEQTQSEETDSTFGRGVANLSSLNAFSNRKENGMKDSKLNAESSDSIVTDLSIKLAMKDAEIQKLKSSLMNSKFSTQECGDILGKSCVLLDRGSPELMSNRNKKDDRRSMERHLEEERCRPIEVERLQTQLLDAEATISMLQTQLTEQINNFEQIQEQLSEKSKYIGNVEEELRKTKSQLAIMEKQLEEKTIVCTANAVKAIEHEQEIAEKSEEIIKLEKFIAEQHQENIIACEHIKKIQTEQYQELEQQIEILQAKISDLDFIEADLQSQLEEKEQQLKKQKQTISNVQEEINAKQSRIESLEFLLEEAREEIKKQDNRNNAALKSLQNQTDEEASKVKDLENALAVSKEELKIQSQQFEDIREQQKKQIEKKSEEVLCLQKQLKISAINLKESNEQNMQLQQTLVQYQQMLQQGTARIGELEDHQAMLERQVSQLEQELYKQKMAYTDELSKTEGKLLKAYDGQDSKHQQVVELTSALKEIKTAMDNCKDETTALEKELLQLRRDSANKDIQLNQLEMTLRNTQIELDKKSDQVLDLEENLHKIETDRRNALQENQKIEAQLRNARSELHDTLSQLKELRDVLQTAQNNMEEKKNVIEELTHEIRQYKNELQDRNVKIIEMDQALKDRQWELQQRAAQLTQLDMNVHEHKTEMEQKMICLQSSLEKSELNVKEHSKQVETLDGKLQLIQEELREKDFKLLQKEQQINQLKNEVEGKDVQIDKYEQMLKDKDQCIVKQQKDVFDESQQVRIVHEQMQRCHLELRECQQHLAQTKREVERLSVELDETIRLSQEKEACAAHLAAELGAAQARETQLENRMQAETKKLKEFIKHLNNTHQREISILKERNAHSLPTIIETSETQKSSDQLLRLNQDLEKAQECILHLESELKNQKEVINAAEESLIIKESEIARLQVKISGFERAMGKQQLQSPTLEAQNESNNRKDYTSQLKSFYPLTRNMNRPFSAHDTYGTDIGSALQSLNYSNRIRETLEQSFIEESISLDDTMDASCAGKSENPTLFSQSANSEAEENLELTNLISNSNMDTLSEMLNQLIAMEQTSTKLDSPVNKSSGLSNEQITSKPEDCSTGMYRIQDQTRAQYSY